MGGIHMRKVRPALIVMVVLFVGYCSWIGVAIHKNYVNPKDREEKRFVNDLNSGLGGAFGGSSSWDYKDGQMIITVYRVLEPDQQGSLKASLVRILASKRDEIPANVKSVRLRFRRDYDDKEVIAEFDFPAVITPDMEREWGEDPRNPSTRKASR
jgi:hypothetical protein